MRLAHQYQNVEYVVSWLIVVKLIYVAFSLTPSSETILIKMHCVFTPLSFLAAFWVTCVCLSRCGTIWPDSWCSEAWDEDSTPALWTETRSPSSHCEEKSRERKTWTLQTWVNVSLNCFNYRLQGCWSSMLQTSGSYDATGKWKNETFIYTHLSIKSHDCYIITENLTGEII